MSKTNTDLPHIGKADSHGKKQVVVVGRESRTLQWSIGYTTTATRPYSDRLDWGWRFSLNLINGGMEGGGQGGGGSEFKIIR